MKCAHHDRNEESISRQYALHQRPMPWTSAKCVTVTGPVHSVVVRRRRIKVTNGMDAAYILKVRIAVDTLAKYVLAYGTTNIFPTLLIAIGNITCTLAGSVGWARARALGLRPTCSH